MAVNTITVSLLNSVLSSATARKLFTTIASRRIAELASLKQNDSDAARELEALEDADLIGSAQSGERYYVTAKGLKVARDLEKLPVA
jgi:hypothetical protein